MGVIGPLVSFSHYPSCFLHTVTCEWVRSEVIGLTSSISLLHLMSQGCWILEGSWTPALMQSHSLSVPPHLSSQHLFMSACTDMAKPFVLPKCLFVRRGGGKLTYRCSRWHELVKAVFGVEACTCYHQHLCLEHSALFYSCFQPPIHVTQPPSDPSLLLSYWMGCRLLTFWIPMIRL